MITVIAFYIIRVISFYIINVIAFYIIKVIAFCIIKVIAFYIIKDIASKGIAIFFIRCYKCRVLTVLQDLFFLFLFLRSTSFPCQLYSTVTVAMFFFNFIRDKSKNFFKKHSFYGLQGFLDKALHATIQHWPRIVVAIFHMESLYSMGRVILAFQDAGQELLSDGAYCQHCLSFS